MFARLLVDTMETILQRTMGRIYMSASLGKT